MTLEQEFQKQWEGMCNYVKSEILKQSLSTADLNRIQTIIEAEKKRWFLPGQYHNAWLEKLKKANPDAAQKFEDNLKQLKIEPIMIKKSNSILIVSGLTVAGFAVGSFVGTVLVPLLLPSVWTGIIVTIAGIAVGLAMGLSIRNRKKNDIFDEFCTAYIKQLKKKGETLSQIVSQV